MSVWDQIREEAAKAIVQNKGDLRNVVIFIPNQKEGEMLLLPNDAPPDIKDKVLYYGVRSYYDMLYGMVLIWDAPTFGAKAGPQWTKEERELVTATMAMRKALLERQQRAALLKKEIEKQELAEQLAFARQVQDGNGERAGIVTSSH